MCAQWGLEKDFEQIMGPYLGQAVCYDWVSDRKIEGENRALCVWGGVAWGKRCKESVKLLLHKPGDRTIQFPGSQ